LRGKSLRTFRAMTSIRSYALVTGAYWGFTLTDGALHMLVLLHFYRLGYTPVQISLLFLLYEFFGIVTNLVGGWLGARFGLRVTLLGGLALQIAALLLLSLLRDTWSPAVSVAYVMACQSLSGIAKDLTKMSSKSAIKLVVPDDAQSTLFRWVSLLTGSKNALKGVGYFLGGLLITLLGFTGGLLAMALALAVVLATAVTMLRQDLGKAKTKAKLKSVFSKSASINVLSAARFFLFGSRDVWFAVGLPIFLYALGWNFTEVGAFMAAWVIGYGIVQSVAPRLLGSTPSHHAPQGRTALIWVVVLATIPGVMALLLGRSIAPSLTIVLGLAIFGCVFAINSAVHSYLIVAYADADRVSMDVGFYYGANAAGRLAGTLVSGIAFQASGIEGCLWASAVFLAIAALLSILLPGANHVKSSPAVQ
jgi:predicted MFS family arabinose efflux permease